MEAGALNHTTAVLPALTGRSPLLRLKSDEQLIELTRRGQHGAFEVLVQRYQSRLLAFCRHMLNSTEDAEDVLQEVFAASFNAMIADARAINARPWLYRIARNRCLNHLRRPVSAGQDSMDVFERDGGTTTADTVHKREEFRQIVADVHDLPETQRTALLLREIDALSYDDIAAAMDTTVPSVKSLLVRARVSLAEAAEARLLTCDEVRLELGQVAEGLARSSAPVRRHLKGCERCRVFKGELRRANRALAAVYPLGPLVLVKKFLTAKIATGAGAGASTAGGSSGAAGGASIAGAGGAACAAGGAAGSAGAGGLLSAGFGTVASKAVAGFAAAAIVTAGAVEVKHVDQPQTAARPAVAAVQAPRPVVAFAPQVAAPAVEHQPVAPAPAKPGKPKPAKPAKADQTTKPADQTTPVAATTTPVPAATTTAPANGQHTGSGTQSPPPSTTQEGGSTVVISGGGSGSSSQGGGSASGGQGSGPGQSQSSPPGESSSAPPQPQPAPVVGDPGHGSG
jgi:RNA polymerase sigma factor (sigma-70 family)